MSEFGGADFGGTCGPAGGLGPHCKALRHAQQHPTCSRDDLNTAAGKDVATYLGMHGALSQVDGQWVVEPKGLGWLAVEDAAAS